MSWRPDPSFVCFSIDVDVSKFANDTVIYSESREEVE